MTIVAVAAHRLPGARNGGLPIEALGPRPWRQLVHQASVHGLVGLLADAAGRNAFAMSEEQRYEAVDDGASVLTTSLLLERAAVEVIDALDHHGVETRLLNGTVSAHLDYPDPSLRSFGDIDLLVRTDDLVRARAVVGSLGFRSSDHRRPTRLSDDQRRVLDLHSAPAPRRGAGVSAADLWSDPRHLTLAGRAVATLPDEVRLVVMAANLQGTGGHRLVHQRDLVQLVLRGRGDADRVIDLADRWRCVDDLALAIRGAWDRLGIADAVALSAWAARHRTDGHHRNGSASRPARRHWISRLRAPRS